MLEYDSVKYGKHFLKQVIIRLDFSEFIETVNVFDAIVERAIRVSFNRRGKDQIIRFNTLNVVFPSSDPSAANTSGKFVEGIQREYFSNDRKNKVILSNRFLIFEINNYDSYDNLKDDVQRVILALFTKSKLTIIRTGIRYINIYKQGQIKLQKKFFANEIAASLSVRLPSKIGDSAMVRSMHTVEYHTDCMILNFRYGMFNPNYPGTLEKNDFVLDYDCYTEEPLNAGAEILGCLDQGHEAIQSLFESHITDSLRKVMGNG